MQCTFCGYANHVVTVCRKYIRVEKEKSSGDSTATGRTRTTTAARDFFLIIPTENTMDFLLSVSNHHSALTNQWGKEKVDLVCIVNRIFGKRPLPTWAIVLVLPSDA
jgi:hypothetical protein